MMRTVRTVTLESNIRVQEILVVIRVAILSAIKKSEHLHYFLTTCSPSPSPCLQYVPRPTSPKIIRDTCFLRLGEQERKKKAGDYRTDHKGKCGTRARLSYTGWAKKELERKMKALKTTIEGNRKDNRCGTPHFPVCISSAICFWSFRRCVTELVQGSGSVCTDLFFF